MRVHFIVHASFEKPGTINYWITSKGHTAIITAPYKGEPLPSHDSYDFLIIMGGPQSPTNLTEFPYMADEIAFTKQAIEHNKPILGICLGAQIIGEAFGATTECSPHKEIGAFPITLTAEGLQDPIFQHFPKQFEIMHWHSDMPGLSANAVVLAESAGCPRQVVRYAKNIYGLQCHFEMTPELINGMVKHCESDLQPGLFIQNREQMLAADFTAMQEKLNFILDELSISVCCHPAI